MKIAVLAVQGAFEEQEKVFRELGADTLQLRQAKELEGDFDALVLPGGESTVQGKLLRELDMLDTICELIRGGVPVFATCAGLILLAEHIAGDGETQCLWQTVREFSLCRGEIWRHY